MDTKVMHMSQQLSQTYLCSKCKNKVSMDKIRYDTEGTSLVCLDCYGSKTSRSSSLKNEKEPETKAEKIKVICTDCRYKFSLKKGTTAALKCPYCGNNRLVKDQTSVDEIIKEVSSIGEEY